MSAPDPIGGLAVHQNGADSSGRERSRAARSNWPIAERLVAHGERKVAQPRARDLARLVVAARLARLAEIDHGFESRLRELAPRGGIGLPRGRDVRNRAAAVRQLSTIFFIALSSIDLAPECVHARCHVAPAHVNRASLLDRDARVHLGAMNRVARRFFLRVSIVCAALCARPVGGAADDASPSAVAHASTRATFASSTRRTPRNGRATSHRASTARAMRCPRSSGSAPTKRVIVIVEDPNNVSNGFALPLLDHPLIFLWPTPPDPSSPLGNGAWGDQLSIHEFAHIAHLTRESRNPAVRRLARLLPVKFGPLALRAPRWVTEGYATFVEGRIVRTSDGRTACGARRCCASGRSRGSCRRTRRSMARRASRAATWRISRALRFSSGSRRATATRASCICGDGCRRGSRARFAEAFIGVYGAPPDELYGRFAAELTHDALDVVRRGADHAARASCSRRRGHGRARRRGRARAATALGRRARPRSRATTRCSRSCCTIRSARRTS